MINQILVGSITSLIMSSLWNVLSFFAIKVDNLEWENKCRILSFVFSVLGLILGLIGILIEVIFK